MKRIKIIVLLIISFAFILCAAVFCACKKAENTFSSEEDKNGFQVYQVTFDYMTEQRLTYYSSSETGKIEIPEIPFREGYSFTGWYTSTQFSELFDFNKVVTSDTTVYAQWSRSKNKIHFEGNGSTSGSMEDVEAAAESVVKLPLNSFRKEGYNFKGWSDSAGGSVKNKDGGWYYVTGYSAVTLFAAWEANVYDVALNFCGGEGGSENVEAVYNEALPYAVPPLKKGYLFLGYFSEPNGEGVKFYDGYMRGLCDYTELKGITLYAYWTSAEVTVSFDGNGSQGGEVGNLDTYTGSEIFMPQSGYIRKGYVFTGWNSLPDGSGDFYTADSLFTVPAGEGQISFYAQWQPVVYTVVLDGECDETFVRVDISYDEEHNLPLNTFVNRGYTFACWKSSAGGNEIYFRDGQSVKNLCSENGAEIVLSAVWTPVTVKVTLNKLGGKGGTSSVNVTFGEQFPQAVAPAKTGYAFGGYFSENGGTEYFDSQMNCVGVSDFAEDNCEMFAKWIPLANKIIFNGNGGQGAQRQLETKTDETVTLPQTAFTRTGYTFKCWNTQADGAGESIDAGNSFITPASDGVINLYAVWTPKPITVIFESAGASGSVNNLYSVSGEEITLPQCDFVKDGYDFEGWSLSAAGNDVKQENEIIILEPTDAGFVEVFAVWSLINYAVDYNLGGGANSQNNPSYYTVQSADIVLANPSRTGYDFLGWAEGGIIKSGSTGNKEFTAQWKPTVYSITYILNGGTNSPDNPESYTIESPTILLDDPTYTGMLFEGWQEGNSIETGSTGNRTFTALWEGVYYNIYYDLDGGENGIGNPASYSETSAEIVLTAPQKQGYEFVGWTPLGVIPSGSTGDKTFTAQWRIETYKIEYVLNGGVNSEYNPSQYTIEDDDIFIEDPIKEGYIFDGWAEGMMIEQGSCGDKIFTASWSPVNYHIFIFDVPIETPVDIVYNVESADIKIAVFAEGGEFGYVIESENKTSKYILNKRGYSLSGLFENDNEQSATDIVLISSGSTGDKVFNTKWEIIEYKITYLLNGGTNAQVNPAVYTVECGEIVLAEPLKAGYIFVGWNDENGDTVAVIDNTNLRDITLTAVWIEDTEPEPPEQPEPEQGETQDTETALLNRQ